MIYFKVKAKNTYFKCESKREWRTESEYLRGWEEMSSPEKQTNQAWITFLYLEQAVLVCGFVKKIQDLETLDTGPQGVRISTSQLWASEGWDANGWRVNLGCHWPKVSLPRSLTQAGHHLLDFTCGTIPRTFSFQMWLMYTFHRTQNDLEGNGPARQGACSSVLGAAPAAWEPWMLLAGLVACCTQENGEGWLTPQDKAARMRGMQPCLLRVFTLRNLETDYYSYLFIWLLQVLVAADGIFHLHCDTWEHQSLLQRAGSLVVALELSVAGWRI